MRSIMSGSTTHIRYEHYHFPRIIEIVCPYCEKPTRLINVDAPEAIEHFMDIAGFTLSWFLRCNNCLKRTTEQWNDIKNFKLINEIDIRGEIIWAWNTKHLDYLIEVFSGKETNKNPWAFFRTYINKNWFKKVKNTADLSKLTALSTINKKSLN